MQQPSPSNIVQFPVEVVVTIGRLTNGYMVITGTHQIPCGTKHAVIQAIKGILNDPRPLTRLPDPYSDTDPRLPSAPATSNGDVTLQRSPDPGLNPEVAMSNLWKICEEYAKENLTDEQFQEGIRRYCPGITPREVQLTLASFTNTPAPAHRTEEMPDADPTPGLSTMGDMPPIPAEDQAEFDVIEDAYTATLPRPEPASARHAPQAIPDLDVGEAAPLANTSSVVEAAPARRNGRSRAKS